MEFLRRCVISLLLIVLYQGGYIDAVVVDVMLQVITSA